MVGQAVSEHCRSRGDEVLAYDHKSLDISDAQLVKRELANVTPAAVINCAAWTDVDGCERDPARAHAANADGPENLAIASRNVGAVFDIQDRKSTRLNSSHLVISYAVF